MLPSPLQPGCLPPCPCHGRTGRKPLCKGPDRCGVFLHLTPEPHNTPHNLVPCIPVPHSLASHPCISPLALPSHPSTSSLHPHPYISSLHPHPCTSPLHPHSCISPLHPHPCTLTLTLHLHPCTPYLKLLAWASRHACTHPSMVPQTRAPLPSSAHLVRCPLAGARWAAQPCAWAAGAPGAPARAAWGTGPPRTPAAGWPCAPGGAAHSRSARPRGPSSCLRAQSRALQREHRPAPLGLASPPRPFPGPGGLRLEGET